MLRKGIIRKGEVTKFLVRAWYGYGMGVVRVWYAYGMEWDMVLMWLGYE